MPLLSWLERLNLDEDQLQQLRQAVEPLEMVLDRKWATECEAFQAASLHYNCPVLSLRRYQPDPEAVRLLSEQQARRVRSVPLFRVGNRLYLAVADPENLQNQDFVAQLTGCVIEPVLALSKDIDEALNRSMITDERSSQTLEAITADVVGETKIIQQSAVIEDRDVPTVKLVDHIIMQAIRLGASDLHLEAFPHKVLLRYRIDGQLREFPAPPKAIYAAVVSRIKITSSLDIAERRLPQDGRASIYVDDKKYDLRVSIIPNVHGEGIVIRILNPHAVSMNLTALGFERDILERYERILARPHGVVLVTGPTGSGKSTTLYATLNGISGIAKKIITLEDPVEYQLANITQIQIQPEIGYTYAQGLRAILRHDPDVVLIGEIRDLESAQIAIRAALTGHQMFSTLHTNDAPQAVTRLLDMGIPFYQLQAALNGILAQRLVRRLCPRCRRPDEGSLDALLDLGLRADQETFAGVGCPECNNIGYKGRVAVHELLDFTPSLRRLRGDQINAEDIAHQAASEGAFFTMADSLRRKVLSGVTSVAEALELLHVD
ncbi:MAG: type II/IV secretion system protein [Candidatus Eremiobacteraeota bacterium]|nr:type II/IV secretion system protein [Candidatus Eremiobacteraeota bacterium]